MSDGPTLIFEQEGKTVNIVLPPPIFNSYGNPWFVEYHWQTRDGTAISGSDYNEASGTAVVQSDITFTIPIQLISDGIKDDFEKFSLNVTGYVRSKSNPDNVYITGQFGSYIISIVDAQKTRCIPDLSQQGRSDLNKLVERRNEIINIREDLQSSIDTYKSNANNNLLAAQALNLFIETANTAVSNLNPITVALGNAFVDIGKLVAANPSETMQIGQDLLQHFAEVAIYGAVEVVEGRLKTVAKIALKLKDAYDKNASAEQITSLTKLLDDSFKSADKQIETLDKSISRINSQIEQVLNELDLYCPNSRPTSIGDVLKGLSSTSFDLDSQGNRSLIALDNGVLSQSVGNQGVISLASTHLSLSSTQIMGTIIGGNKFNYINVDDSVATYNVLEADSQTFAIYNPAIGMEMNVESVERVQFRDGIIALDVDGVAGNVYRLYQAAFDRQPDTFGLSHNVHRVDLGLSMNDMAEAFLDSPEFVGRYGSDQNNTSFVTSLYSNVLHRVPDVEGQTAWVNRLENGSYTRAEVLYGFSESPENHALTVPQTENGIRLSLNALM